jgi:hypothetical protein
LWHEGEIRTFVWDDRAVSVRRPAGTLTPPPAEPTQRFARKPPLHPKQRRIVTMHVPAMPMGKRERAPDPFHQEMAASPSSRSFGAVFALAFTLVGAVPWWRGGDVRLWALVVAGMFALAALVAPQALTPLNRLWVRLGLAMHRVVNPVVMGALFYLVVTPLGLTRQAMGKGLTPRLRQEPRAPSYWIERSGHPASRMDQQF